MTDESTGAAVATIRNGSRTLTVTIESDDGGSPDDGDLRQVAAQLPAYIDELLKRGGDPAAGEGGTA